MQTAGLNVATALTVAVSALAAGCAVPEVLTDSERQSVAEIVAEAAGSIGLVIDEEQIGCVVDDLDPNEARAMELEDPGPELAEPLVDCVGSRTVGVVALEPLAPGAQASSIECAAQRLDSEFVVALVARAFDPERPSPPGSELEVTSALALCLSPAEVLAR